MGIGTGGRPGRPSGGTKDKGSPAFGWGEGNPPPTHTYVPTQRGLRWGTPPVSKTHNDPRYVRYKEGDQLLPLKLNLPGDQVTALQLQLIDAGYLPASGVFAGSWDEKSANALKNAMTDANRNGMDVNEWLGRRIQVAASGGVIGGKQRGNFELPVFKVDNPEDLKDVFKQVSQQIMGHYASDEEVDSMVLAYQGMQMGAQQRGLDRAMQENTAQEAGQMGVGPVAVEENLSSPEDYARRRLKEMHPIETAATTGAEGIQAALDFIRGNR